MAGSHSPSSSQEPIYSIADQQPASKPSSRRLPPPCWSDDETVALIDVYRDKWYSLRRGNLRSPDWQEVADGVAARCPFCNPPKTSIQCRHKMEKLRKRYRAEIQRIGNPQKLHRYTSSWIHFKLMYSMESGTSSSSDPFVDPSNEDDEEEEDLILYPKGVKHGTVNRIVTGNRNGNGVRIKIPNFAGVTSPSSNRSFDDLPPPVKRKKEDGNVMDEMVAAIQKLGDGFVKMEKMKMDMAMELESMRMKTEMKQTEMILETQQKLWDSFSRTVVEKNKKKIKRMPPTQENPEEF